MRRAWNNSRQEMIGGKAGFPNLKKQGKSWLLITMIRNFGNVISSPEHCHNIWVIKGTSNIHVKFFDGLSKCSNLFWPVRYNCNALHVSFILNYSCHLILTHCMVVLSPWQVGSSHSSGVKQRKIIK
jgi:hypothetical protein